MTCHDMYLIFLFPTELNDNVLILLKNFDLAVQNKRFWVAGKLYDKNKKNGGSRKKLTIKVLIEIIRYLNLEKKNSLLGYTCEKGYVKIVKLLLSDPRVDPTTNYNYAIRFASEKGHLEVVKLLLSDHRVDPTAKNNESIRLAAKNGHDKVVSLLLADPRVDHTSKDNAEIYMSSYN